jgi:O-antigen ligase
VIRLGAVPKAGHFVGTLAAIVGLVSLLSWALVTGHLLPSAAIAIAPLVTFGLISLGATLSELHVGQRRFVFLWSALVISTFVWRDRTTTQLDTNPLDSAGLVRVVLIALAALMLFAWLPAMVTAVRRVPLPLRFYGLYLAVALLSAVLSPLPLQALYRVAELSVGLFAVLVAPVLFGENAGERILNVVMATISLILALVWIEALLMPARAWLHVYFYGFIPVQLHGAVPDFPSNTVGMLGGLLALWGLSIKRGNPFLRHGASLLGIATLVATGYRTGLIGLLLAGGLILWLRRRFGWTLLAVTAVVVILAALGTSGLEATGEKAISHGQTRSQLQTLDSRTFYWNEAQTLVAQRPALGWGLNVGSREALVSLGEDSTSSLHSTWFEALVGTGYTGLVCLVLAFISALFCAWRVCDHPIGPSIVAMLLFLLVRSVTGTTIELFNIPFLIFGALVVAIGTLCVRRNAPDSRDVCVGQMAPSGAQISTDVAPHSVDGLGGASRTKWTHGPRPLRPE